MAQHMILYIGLAFVSFLLVTVVVVTRRIKRRETDYRTFFIMGLIWLPVGLLFDFQLFYILGLSGLIIGLANRDKWEKSRIEEAKTDR